MDGSALLFKGGDLAQNGKVEKADLLVIDGKIAGLGPSLVAPQGAEVVDCTDLLVAPAFADVHVHFREPGFPQKETVLTGSKAAARGGYTLVCPMPNLNPVPDSPETLEAELRLIREAGIVDVRPYCSITKERKGRELVDMAALKDSCVAFSDDGSGVQDGEVMLRAMQMAAAQDCIIAAHCEDNTLLKGGYIHDGRYCAAHGHKGICSESEWGQIARDLELCRETGCHYHVCHISTAESVDIIRRAKARGVNVTCETAPHYLVLCEDDLQEDGRFKMNPPLRSAADREALIEGLADGTVDMIATDHAPHTVEEKSRGLALSAMGIVGLETSFPVLYTALVRGGRISLERLVEAMSLAPRRLFRLGGGIEKGLPADLAIIDLNSKYKIDSSSFLSKGRSTPFDGMEVYSRVVMTYRGGNRIY